MPLFCKYFSIFIAFSILILFDGINIIMSIVSSVVDFVWPKSLKKKTYLKGDNSTEKKKKLLNDKLSSSISKCGFFLDVRISI
jgi:uncharacterized membrane-anchored protein YitT (DUF2179 family)